ncbi:hypothetical protein LX32DRAFT_96417 [Colletotrichum zoysiae]|uniref:Uncharacterized protein n=1 Tax=Colletotrichum zoysiae TaxID=1216348 RepID=A0AAD9H956_9PEZI|nr:hypothetical protein LX32DRAFT_96417 [Colletotrichum zoysiae]
MFKLRIRSLSPATRPLLTLLGKQCFVDPPLPLTWGPSPRSDSSSLPVPPSPIQLLHYHSWEYLSSRFFLMIHRSPFTHVFSLAPRLRHQTLAFGLFGLFGGGFFLPFPPITSGLDSSEFFRGHRPPVPRSVPGQPIPASLVHLSPCAVSPFQGSDSPRHDKRSKLTAADCCSRGTNHDPSWLGHLWPAKLSSCFLDPSLGSLSLMAFQDMICLA